MKVATYEGFIENGKIRLPDNIHLPEKAKVYVIVPDIEVQSVAYIASPRLVYPEQAEDFKKEVIQEINDAGI
jgi:hypothetical protein